MSDAELRAAAAKACLQIRELSADVADTLSGSHGPGDPFTYRGTLLHNLLDAALALKKAWHNVAEPPDDDREPVTDRWLRSVGFAKRCGVLTGHFEIPFAGGDRDELLYLSVSLPDTRPGIWCYEADSDKKEATDVICLGKPCDTRGELRRLCRALGVELKEQTR